MALHIRNQLCNYHRQSCPHQALIFCLFLEWRTDVLMHIKTLRAKSSTKCVLTLDHLMLGPWGHPRNLQASWPTFTGVAGKQAPSPQYPKPLQTSPKVPQSAVSYVQSLHLDSSMLPKGQKNTFPFVRQTYVNFWALFILHQSLLCCHREMSCRDEKLWRRYSCSFHRKQLSNFANMNP